MPVTFEGFITGFTFSDENQDLYTCTGTSTDTTCFFAGGTCLNFGGTTGQVCAAIAMVCAAYCEDENGVAIAGACTGVGTGTCAQPTDIYVGTPVREGGETAPVECSTAGVQDTCSAGFLCTDYFVTDTSSTLYCARPRKICN
jgi:hypothetical protein